MKRRTERAWEMLRLSNWETPTWLGNEIKGTAIPVAVFNVELDGDRILLMRLWRNGDAFDVRCGPEHQVEMSADTRGKILDMAVREYKVRSNKL